MRHQLQEIWEKLTVSERVLICAQFYETARDIIVDNAPKDLTENQLKRYVYEKMYHEVPPAEFWPD
jgi:hypothetical protein